MVSQCRSKSRSLTAVGPQDFIGSGQNTPSSCGGDEWPHNTSLRPVGRSFPTKFSRRLASYPAEVLEGTACRGDRTRQILSIHRHKKQKTLCADRCGGKCCGNIVQISRHNRLHVVPRFFDAVVGNAALGEIVGADFLRAVGCADLFFARAGEFFLSSSSLNISSFACRISIALSRFLC